MTSNRRIARIPLQIALNEYVVDEPHRCMSLNLGLTGIYLQRLAQPVRRPSVVGLEFELPRTSETVWARGEVVFDQFDDYFHGTGVRFTGLTRFHERMIRDFVLEERERRLRKLLSRVQRNRRLTWRN